MKKRILSILLTALLVVSMIPTTAFAEGSDYTVLDGTDGFENEGLSNLFDKSETTKWCAQFKGSAHVIFETAASVNVSGYSLTTGNDNSENPGRNPMSWVLYACNDYTGKDTGSWVKIHSVKNDTVLQDEDKKTYHFVFDKTETAYKYFKLEISAIHMGDVMQLSEFALTDCDHTWSSDVTEPTCTTIGYATVTCSSCKNFKGFADRKAMLNHDFSAEDGKCTHCGRTEALMYTFDVSEGTVNIQDGEFDEVKVSYGNGKLIYVDPKETITVTGSTTTNELHVDAATPVSIRVKDLTINRGSNMWSPAFLIEGNGGAADVTLILEGENTFIGGIDNAGVQVEQGRKLTITGSGTLNATGTREGAGIGGGYSGSCGTITISGGTVKATSKDGAGIGGGYGDLGGGNGGNITITGGNVTASSTYGAGIGGGYGSLGIEVEQGIGGYGGSGGNITITGGTVTASSTYGAGIGGGDGEIGTGDAGKFRTNNGNAVIFTNSIGDKSGKASDAESPWSGVIFEGNSGKVYGNCVTPSEDFTIESGKTLTIDSDKVLCIPRGVTLSNKGTISNSGKIYVDGTFEDTSDTANVYYLLALENASASGDTVSFNEKTYVKAGSEITLTPETPKAGYELKEWEVSGADVTVIDNKFTMPSAAISIKAQWEDITAPTGEITIGANSWDSINSSVDFDLFFNTAQEVTITAEDNSSDTVTIEYLLSANEISSDELDTLSFNTYTEAITISPDSEYVVYAKLTDTSGNVTYLSSTGIVLDATNPVISGIENGKTYCSAQTVTVTEEYIASVTVNGEEVTLDENNQFTLSPAEGEQTIVVTDKAGNVSAEMIVSVNDGHTYDEWQSNGDSMHIHYCTVDGCDGYETENCSGGEASYFKKAVCEKCNEEYGELLKDSTAPTGEITIATNKWNSFLNTITFGIFFKDTQSVTITASDDSYSHAGYTDDKVVKVEYYLYSGDTALTEADLADKEFTLYSGDFNINPDNKYVVYAKLTDHAGNVTYISSDGVVSDATAPVISGIESGKTYCSAQTVTVTEEYLESVTVNGEEVTLDENNQFTLSPADGEQTIVVTDKAGNVSAEMIVTVNDGHTYQWQSENGQYWGKCTICGDETAKKDIPEITIDGADSVYRTEDYKFTFTLPEGVVSATYGYEFENKGNGGIEPTIEDGKMSAIIPADIYEPTEDSFKIIVEAITDDGFAISVSKTITINPIGDIDSDEEIKMLDVVLVQKAIAKLVELTPEQKAAADVNGDKKITMVDVVLIQRYIAKLITSFD